MVEINKRPMMQEIKGINQRAMMHKIKEGRGDEAVGEFILMANPTRG